MTKYEGKYTQRSIDTPFISYVQSTSHCEREFLLKLAQGRRKNANWVVYIHIFGLCPSNFF